MAMDIANLCSFELLESWTEVLFADLVRDPPLGFQRVSVDQLARADRELWTRIADRCRAGIRPEPDGTRPFETDLKNLIFAPEIRLLLVPLPRGGGNSGPSASASVGSGDGAPSVRQLKRIAQLEQENAQLKKIQKTQDNNKGTGKQKKTEWSSSRASRLARQIDADKGGGSNLLRVQLGGLRARAGGRKVWSWPPRLRRASASYQPTSSLKGWRRVQAGGSACGRQRRPARTPGVFS